MSSSFLGPQNAPSIPPPALIAIVPTCRCCTNRAAPTLKLPCVCALGQFERSRTTACKSSCIYQSRSARVLLEGGTVRVTCAVEYSFPCTRTLVQCPVPVLYVPIRWREEYKGPPLLVHMLSSGGRLTGICRSWSHYGPEECLVTSQTGLTDVSCSMLLYVLKCTTTVHSCPCLCPSSSSLGSGIFPRLLAERGMVFAPQYSYSYSYLWPRLREQVHWPP